MASPSDSSAPRALITGGAGFIGSHLAELLLERGVRVVCLDDLSTGRIANVRPLEGRPGFRLLIGNAADPALLREAAEGVDTVYHLAAAVGVRKVVADPVDTIERNLHITEAVLRLASQYRLRLLLASTSEVYGAGVSHEWFREDDAALIGPPRKRRLAYAATKLTDEFHAFAYHFATGLAVTVVRLFNTVGPRQVDAYGMVVPTFVRQALAGRPLTVHGDGTQRRTFTYVADVVRCLADLVARPDTAGEVYNIGSSEEIAIGALAERVIALVGQGGPVTYQRYDDVYGADFVDMERRRPDVSKLRATLGYAPDTPLDDALRAVIAHERALANTP